MVVLHCSRLIQSFLIQSRSLDIKRLTLKKKKGLIIFVLRNETHLEKNLWFLDGVNEC